MKRGLNKAGRMGVWNQPERKSEILSVYKTFCTLLSI